MEAQLLRSTRSDEISFLSLLRLVIDIREIFFFSNFSVKACGPRRALPCIARTIEKTKHSSRFLLPPHSTKNSIIREAAKREIERERPRCWFTLARSLPSAPQSFSPNLENNKGVFKVERQCLRERLDEVQDATKGCLLTVESERLQFSLSHPPVVTAFSRLSSLH